MMDPKKGGRTFIRMDKVNDSLGGQRGINPQHPVGYPVKVKKGQPPSGKLKY